MPDFSQLTDKQREIYDFIRSKIEQRGYGPTVREIGEAFEIKSPNGVMCHLKALEKKGCIIRKGFSARAIQLVDHRPPGASLPPPEPNPLTGEPFEVDADGRRVRVAKIDPRLPDLEVIVPLTTGSIEAAGRIAPRLR